MESNEIIESEELEEISNLNNEENSNTDNNPSTNKSKKKDKKKEQDDLIQLNDELIENIYQQVLKDNKNPLSIFKNHMLNIPKYKDEVLIALMIKLKLLKGYKCHSPGCTVKKAWKRKPIQLLFNRKNNKKYDLRPENLELICPNCYLQVYGVQKLLDKLDNLVIKCSLCGYPLNNAKNKGNYNKYCYVCSKKIAQQSETEFENNHSRKIMEISSGKNIKSLNKYSFKNNNNNETSTDFRVNYDSSTNKFMSSISESNNEKTNTIKMNMNIDLDLNQFVDELSTDNKDDDNGNGNDTNKK